MQIDYQYLHHPHPQIQMVYLNPRAPGMNRQGSNLILHDLGMTAQVSSFKMREPGMDA